jgi:hypothetical protein
MYVEAREETAVKRMSQVKIVEAPAGVRSQAANIPAYARQTSAFCAVNTFQSLHTLEDAAQTGKKRLYRWPGGIHAVETCHAQTMMLPLPQGWW